jgi:hypothetical protein
MYVFSICSEDGFSSNAESTSSLNASPTRLISSLFSTSLLRRSLTWNGNFIRYTFFIMEELLSAYKRFKVYCWGGF